MRATGRGRLAAAWHAICGNYPAASGRTSRWRATAPAVALTGSTEARRCPGRYGGAGGVERGSLRAFGATGGAADLDLRRQPAAHLQRGGAGAGESKWAAWVRA